MLHELAHWALKNAHDLPVHGRTFTRLLLDATTEFGGAGRAERLAAGYAEHKVHVGKPARLGPTVGGTTTGTNASGSAATRVDRPVGRRRDRHRRAYLTRHATATLRTAGRQRHPRPRTRHLVRHPRLTRLGPPPRFGVVYQSVVGK